MSEKDEKETEQTKEPAATEATQGRWTPISTPLPDPSDFTQKSLPDPGLYRTELGEPTDSQNDE